LKKTISELEKLITDFSNRSLSKSDWTHEAHLIVALWHNFHYDFEEALQLVKSKIISYNEFVGTLNTDTSGYHETLTIFWMLTTKKFVDQNKDSPIHEVVNQFLISNMAEKVFPLAFYSKELLFSQQARKTWVDGDLRKVPKND